MPGTYHVVVNPDSFSDIPEYVDKETSPASPASRGSIQGSQRDSTGSSRGVSVLQEPNDPNVVILRRFEDSSRRSQAQPSQFQEVLGHSPYAITPASIRTATPLPPDSSISSASPSSLQFMGGQDEHLLSHFRVFVWPCLAQVTPHGHDPGLAMVEEEALRFPPVSIHSLNWSECGKAAWHWGSKASLALDRHLHGWILTSSAYDTQSCKLRMPYVSFFMNM